jgi:hypothetical protein
MKFPVLCPTIAGADWADLLGSIGDTLNEIHFRVIERRPILPKDVMEPDAWLRSAGFGTPWVNSLRLALDQTPIVAANTLALENGLLCL